MEFEEWADDYALDHEPLTITDRRLDCLAAWNAAMTEAVKKPPAVLFDGFAVMQALDENAKARTSAVNVSDVLDAVVRLMRSNAPGKPTAANELNEGEST